MNYGFLKLPFNEQVAKDMINNYCLIKHYTLNGVKKEVLYRFLEIESYLYENGGGDLNTIFRECDSGELFVHDYGIDIAYQTEKDGDKYVKFGGILIRGVEVYECQNGYWIKKKIVGGPILTMREILYHIKEIPKIETIPDELKDSKKIKMTKRIGFEDLSETKRRAIVENVEWKKYSEQIVKTKDENSCQIIVKTGCRDYRPQIIEKGKKILSR